MSTFTLAISYLTISNLPWFMDLTFQVPMKYCSLQQQTLLSSPVTSTTGCCFCFGSVSSLFLELFLHSSQVAYWAPTDLRSSSFSVISFCLFIPFLAGKSINWYNSLGKMFGGIFWSCTYLYQAILFLGETCIIVPQKKCTKCSQQPIHKRPKVGTAHW